MSVVACALLLAGPPKLPLTGTYEVATIPPGGKKIVRQSATTPRGPAQYLVISKGRFIVFDMMLGSDGKVATKGRTVTMTFLVNPLGKMKRPDVVIFDASADGRTLTGRPKTTGGLRIVLLWKNETLLMAPNNLPRS